VHVASIVVSLTCAVDYYGIKIPISTDV